MELMILASMSHSANPPIRGSRGLLGLFQEAWRRQRRRRWRLALLALAVLTAAAVAMRTDRRSGEPVSSSYSVLARVSSGVLPAAGHYASLTQVGSHLIAAGGPGGYPLNISGASTSLVRGRAAGRCTAATVAPNSVRLERVRHANCGDPALYGLSVMPIISLQQIGHRPATDEVRIAVADPAARDGYRLGPVVMRYFECSDCGAQWVIGDHSLWINGPYARPERRSGAFQGEVLRVSSRTGRVRQQFAVPELSRALLAVNQNGLWIAPSIETGRPAGHLSPRVRRAYSSLYLIAPGAQHAREVLHVDNGIPWLTATEDRVWLEESSHGADRMLTFTGSSAQHRREGPRQHLVSGMTNEIGEGTTPYAARPAGGVAAVTAPNNSHQTVIAYSTKTLTHRVLATTPRPDAYDEQPDAVATHGSVYFLDPELALSQDSIPGDLYRLHTR